MIWSYCRSRCGNVPIIPPIEVVQLGPAGEHLEERRRGLDLYVGGIAVVVPDDLLVLSSAETVYSRVQAGFATLRRAGGIEAMCMYGRSLTLMVNLSSVIERLLSLHYWDSRQGRKVEKAEAEWCRCEHRKVEQQTRLYERVGRVDLAVEARVVAEVRCSRLLTTTLEGRYRIRRE